MNLITPYRLTGIDKLHSMVEHRNRFNLDFCELNVFETHKQAYDFKLKFGGFTITSMLRGKKVMRLKGVDDFEYLPGETLLAPAETLLRIDFPEAEMEHPTQCTALVLDNSYLFKQLEHINSTWNQKDSQLKEWKINPDEFFLKNNTDLARISTRLLDAFTANDPFKEYQVDLILRELVLCMLKLQNLSVINKEHKSDSNRSPFHAVLNYISNNLSSDIRIEVLCRIACMSKSSFYRAFTDEYGITPVQLILEERIKYAKTLLCEDNISIKEIAYACGFNDPNYFSRMFKKMENESPVEFRTKNKKISKRLSF
ncbi:helix-turn-helix domain-containing protein [Chondrinema litorale]|uniref:helix-turn-helix domain-containing protein n=1 Tax=Chondrinema litorale TaxID=2994555 RepID=UPI002542AD6C|nr:helix-turn-helix domain-containing protein [Chondrinema litorale]UZR97792.1 helix-turn-helix domain-containing protein [Chondrinema litorale]